MGNKLKINCMIVHQTSLDFIKLEDSYRTLIEQLKKVRSGIDNVWDGVDYNNYLASLNAHISNLSNVCDYLESRAELLEACAKNHGNIDSNLLERIKRDENER